MIKQKDYDILYKLKNNSWERSYEMTKIICKKEYNTETSTFIKKVTVGTYGDPAGYEECLFVTESGNYFLYTQGGAESKYPTEDIKRMSKKVADEWIANN